MMKDGLKSLWIRKANNRFEAIDGLRALSILWMISFHVLYGTGFFLSAESFLSLLDHNYLVPLLQGHMGVDIFFVLSGFLIGYYLMEEYKNRGKISFGNFYIKRAFRLLPVYYFVLFIYGILVPKNVENVWANLLYVNNFIPFENQFMGWAWSLAIEEQFYILFPILMVACFKWCKKSLWVFTGLFLASFVIRYVLLINISTGIPGPLHAVLGEEAFNGYFDSIYTKPYSRYAGILLGVISAYLLVFTDFIQRLNRGANLRRGLILFSALFTLPHLAVSPFTDGSKFPNLTLYYLTTYRTFFSMGIAALIVYLLTEAGKNSILGKLLSARWFFPIAQASYSAYLVHLMVIFPTYKLWLTSDIKPAHFVFLIPGLILITLLISAFLYVFVEYPFMKKRVKFLNSYTGAQ